MSDIDAKKAVENAFAKEMPQIMMGLSNYFNSVMTEGALTIKQKELIALAISVALACRPSCINAHIAQALNLGASKKEILEAISVAMFVGGGRAVACAVEATPFLNEKAPGIEPVKV